MISQRMEVGREVSAASSAAEGFVASDAGPSASQRLIEVAEERQRWISKRDETLVRKENLLKLLQLHAPNIAKYKQIDALKAQNEEETAKEEENKAAKAAAAALARKKELKELQARAEAAKEKQQAAASVLARNLKQLQAKRKREEKETDEQPRKQAHASSKDAVETPVAAPEMHPFAAAPDLDMGTADLAGAACFRISTRHLTQTGTMISREKLEQAFKTYTGKVLDKVVDWSLLKRSLASLDVDKPRQTAPPSTSRRSLCWQPGRQTLKTPTFISSDAGRIQSLIEVEKEVVVAVCDSLQPSDKRELKSAELIRKRRQRSFFVNWLADSATTPTLSAFLSASVGVDSVKPTTGNTLRISNRSHGQMAGVLDKMETWLREQAETSDPHSSSSPRLDGLDGARGARENFFSSKYAKPFSVANESVVRQLRGAGTFNPTTSKKIDPMKILCHYEINGACNDKNCSNYHQKDYEPVVREMNNANHCTNDDDARVLKLDEMDQLLLLFAEYRGRIMKKWPVITASPTSSATTGKSDSGNSVATDALVPSGADAAVPVTKDLQHSDGDPDKDNGDFIALDSREDLPEIDDARYFDNVDSKKAYGNMLQTKMEEDPTNTDAWLLLAIYQLELVVGVSDEAVNFSDEDRLQQQLVCLCKELNMKQRSGASRFLNVEEANLKRCLHTISRALEVEANAYCEALWLLYLHLCRQATNKQTEIDMVEQAVQFLPSSHALWLRYISTYEFDSVGMAEGIYWRLLEHLARVNSAEDEAHALKPTPTKELSILLTAICFHLCIKLWRAGATSRVLELLSALLQFGDTSSEFGWCSMVRGQLRSDELIVFCLVFAHVLLFKELPGLIEHWVAASSYESIPVKRMAYSLESLRRGWRHIDEDVFGRVLASYELAFQTVEKECDGEQDAGNTILCNWMLVLKFQDDISKKDEALRIFFQEKFDTIQQYPGASLTAAKIMGLKSTGKQQAYQLMLTMMNRSSETQFPEALHHYLFACRQSPPLVDALDKTFPDVMERLASHLDVDIDKVEKSIRDIMHDTSNISKSRALKALLDALLTAWIDQLTLLRRGSNRNQSMDQRTKSLADIFVALDICHLMGVLLEPSVAIDGIQMVLSSSSFGALSHEARQLAWMQHFVFQVDLLQLEESDNLSWREHQTRLTRLFRKYMAEMSVEAEMVRQVSKQILRDIARNSIDGAVCACLYPERSCLSTFGVNLELFRLCSNAVAEPDKTVFYASFTDSLALSPEFSLAFSDIATHEWELLAARASLRKSLGGAKTQHPQILQALVAVELRLRNMKAVSSLLESEMESDPLLLETWRLVVGLEILFGEKLDARSKKISEEMEKRQLVFTCNTFGDEKMLEQKNISGSGDLKATSLTLRGRGLECVPNAVLLKDELVSLDISGNELIELPMGLRRLQNLRELDASENALIEFPAGVNGLTQLKELRLAHNNIATISLLGLPHLNVLDIRWNAVTRLPAPALFARTCLKMLHAEGNPIPVDELSKSYDLLSSRKDVTSQNLDTQTSEGNSDGRAEEKREEFMKEQPAHATLSDNYTAQRLENSSAVTSVEVTESADTERTSITTEELDTTLVAKEDDGDQIMEQKSVDAAYKSKEDEGDQMMDLQEVDTSCISPPKVDGGDQVMVQEDAGALSTSKEDNGDQIMVQESTDDSTTKESTMVNKAIEQPNEVIEVDGPESPKESYKEVVTTNTNAEGTAETTNNVIDLSISAGGEPSMNSIVEAEDFAQDHYEVVTAAAARRQSSHEVAIIARRKLAAYMEHNHIDNRAEVRKRNPTLWREFLAASLPVNLELPACRLCFAPNDGHNQRFNSTVLCMHCLEDALLVLKERNEQADEVQESV